MNHFLSLNAVLSLLAIFSQVQAAAIQARHADPEPVYAYVTVTDAPVYVTQYVNGATAGQPDVQFSTDNAGAKPFFSTQWPAPAPPAPAATSQAPPPPPPPAPPAPPAAAVTTSPVAPAPPPAPTTTSAPPPPPAPTSTLPYSTVEVSTQAPPPPPPPPAPTTSSSSSSPPPPASSSSSSSPPPPPPPAETSSEPAPAPTTNNGGSSGPSITALPQYMVYSPYNDDHSCKNSGQVYNDLKDIKSKGISKIRVYATDCNSLETVQPNALALGLKIFQGIWIGSAGLSNIDQSLQALISWGTQNGWSMIEKINVGNEDVTNGFVSANDLVNKVRDVRSQLRAAGFNGPVMTAEVTDTIQNNRELCDTSAFDVLGLNAHSYFSPSFAADRAGEFVQDQINLVQQACGNSNVFITETGYPSQGNTNGLNVPSKENQAIAVNSIMDAVGGNAVLLTQYNDMWKDPGPYNVEQYFGTIDICT